uniref:Retrovirus-related Pol polyprotein from transposon TNT 1-94-like beta-barrel domain-containing protein n=1 Tax=Cajanus cajan TaxID=3821 RepID=A0A151S064_CAJCA|nr:hypothetical protein KK1_030099 [Cajanus cajan]
MTGHLEYLTDVKTLVDCPVGLPKGEHTTTTKEGTVILNNKLKLTNVLFVPSLHCYLILVSQLLHESDCVVHFIDTTCVI